MATRLYLITLCISTLFISFITSQPSNTTSNNPAQIDYCVGPLIHSSHSNPIQEYGGPFIDCGLSCESGQKIYGLSSNQQALVDYTTIIGTIFCLIGLVILSVNLYFDLKVSKEKFLKKPILFHIPYIITLSTFVLTFLMSMSLIFGKETVICDDNEFSFWNPGYGKSISCTTFGIFFYSSLLYYQLYVLLLSFIVWRQFKNPMNPLWNIRDRYWHLFIAIVVLFLNITALATASVDAIEPMGVCLAGVADKTQLFLFVVLPMFLACVFSAIFLIWSGFLVKNNINRHKNNVSKNATMKMVDLFQRILWYGFGVLFTLSLLVATGFKFYLKHSTIRNGLKEWINCELQNYFTPDILDMDVDCDSLRNIDHKISPFYFMSWIISCLMAICAQIILSFHSKARERATVLKQNTLDKISTKMNSPKRSKDSNTNTKTSNSKLNKLEIKSEESGNDETDEYRYETAPQTITQVISSTSNGSNGSSDNPNTTMMVKIQSHSPDSPQSIQEAISE